MLSATWLPASRWTACGSTSFRYLLTASATHVASGALLPSEAKTSRHSGLMLCWVKASRRVHGGSRDCCCAKSAMNLACGVHCRKVMCKAYLYLHVLLSRACQPNKHAINIHLPLVAQSQDHCNCTPCLCQKK